MFPLIFVIFAVFSQSSGNPASLDNHNIFCHKVDKDLDYSKFYGSWHEVALLTSAGQPANSVIDTCFHAEFIGVIREHSHDVVMRADGKELMYLKNVDGNGTGGCYQKVKNFDDPVIRVKPAYYINLMMTQFHVVESSEIYLVQIIWETRVPGSIALVYKKTPGGTVKELEPVINLVTKIRGPQQSPQFCTNEKNDLPRSYPINLS